MYICQRTIHREVGCTGIGLHSGRKVSIKLKPANPNEGINFIRADLPERPRIPATLDSVVDTNHATTLGLNGCCISTVEHIMAAVMAMGIDNIDIEVDAEEVPIMDGSAAPLVFLLKSAGVRNQQAPKRFILIKKPIIVEDGDKRIEIYPSKNLKINYLIEFNHPMLKKQEYCFTYSDRLFEKEISRARTFGFLHEVEQLKKNGLALGGSLANAVVLGDFNVLNPDGLRYSDEFVRHKILDFIGDISLIGMPIIGHFVAHKSGHTLNHILLNTVRALSGHWVEINLPIRVRSEKKGLPLKSPAILNTARA